MLMRRFIDIVMETLELSEAASMNEVFNEARAALTAALNPNMSYQLATTNIIQSLTKVAKGIEEPSHPIHVLVDIYPNDPKTGRLTAHQDGAWMVINFERAIEGDWGRLSDQEMTTTVFRIAQAFAQEMQHYRQYLRNWNYFADKGGDTPDNTSKSDAATAARELIAHYGDAAAAIEAMKSKIGDAVNASEAMARSVRGTDRESVKRFLSDLYTQLQG